MLAVVDDVAASFVAAGRRLYLVGGVVRDLFLDAFSANDDIDLTTDADPAQIRSLLRPHATDLWAQGERFGTIGAWVRGRAIEITTHRAEAYDPSSRKPVVSFGHSIVDDLSRRDFTINAMALSLPDRTLSDPFGGAADLAGRILRTPLSPEVSFTDDPLRMLRAARFLPRFDLVAEPGLEAAAAELAPRLAIVSVERIREELERLLAVADPARGLAFLERTGLLAQAIPAFAGRSGAQATACQMAAIPASAVVRRAGLFGPLGPSARAALSALRYPHTEIDATARLLEAVPAALSPAANPETVRRVVDRIGLSRMDELTQLTRNVVAVDPANVAAVDPAAVDPAAVDPAGAGAPSGLPFFVHLVELLEREDLSCLGSPLSGRQVMDHLGLEPGPLVGRALARLRHHRLVEGPVSEDDAYRLLDAWAGDLAVGDMTAGGHGAGPAEGHSGADQKTGPPSG